MKVKIIVTAEINPIDSHKNFNKLELVESTRIAVKNSLNSFEARGFNHPLGNNTYINIVSVK
jgi:hypothetical protein